MTVRVIVIDDEDLPRRRVRELAERHPQLEVIGEAADGAEALDRIVALRPQLIFLDIRMPELDGFQLLSALDGEVLPAVVFVTAYDDYAIRAFETGAFDYLLKPITKERFDAAVQRVLDRSGATPVDALHELAARLVIEQGHTTRLVARRAGRHYIVNVADIEWLEAEGNYVRLHSGTTSHLVRHTMKDIEARLDPGRFVRIHRSCIVALDRIRSIEAREHGEYELTMTGGSSLRSSRTYSPRVRALLRTGRASTE